MRWMYWKALRSRFSNFKSGKSVRIILVLMIVLCASYSWSNEACTTIYNDKNITLCIQNDLDYLIFNKPVYSLYGSLKSSDKMFKLSEEVIIKGIRSIQKINENLYFYKAYLGGNSINAENRHVLLVTDSEGIYKAGEFSALEYSEDGVLPSFFRFKEVWKPDGVLKFDKHQLVLDGNVLK